MIIRWLKPMLAVVLSLNFSVAMAVVAEPHQHAGDIQPWKSNGQAYTNGNLFEADFGDLSGGLYKTDDPGIDADTSQGAFGAGNWLQLQVLGTLQFWNGSSWGGTANGEYVTIDDALGEVTTISSSGVTNPFAVVGEFDALGDIHEHLDFSIRNAANALGGSVGAYWIDLVLLETAPFSTSPLSTISAPFSIIFNRGLAEVDFENAVSAVTAVPVPGAVWLFGSALAGLVAAGRKRSIGVSA